MEAVIRRVVGGFLAMVLVLVGTVGSAGAQAPVLSPGCQQLNLPIYDGVYQQQQITDSFTVGETITVVAAEPATGSPNQTFVAAVDVAPPFGASSHNEFFFPATVSTTIVGVQPGATSQYVVGWGVGPAGSTATFTVTCEAAAYPLAVDVARPAAAGVQVPVLSLDEPPDPSGSAPSNLALVVGIVGLNLAGAGMLSRRGHRLETEQERR